MHCYIPPLPRSDAEEVYQESAVKALQTWQRLTPQQLANAKCFYDVSKSIDAMLLLASIFKLSFRVSLLHTISEAMVCVDSHSGVCSIATLFVTLKFCCS